MKGENTEWKEEHGCWKHGTLWDYKDYIIGVKIFKENLETL